MAWRDWDPPQWLVWSGFACATAFGVPMRIPELPTRKPDDAGPLARYLNDDLDEALARLLADDVGH